MSESLRLSLAAVIGFDAARSAGGLCRHELAGRKAANWRGRRPGNRYQALSWLGTPGQEHARQDSLRRGQTAARACCTCRHYSSSRCYSQSYSLSRRRRRCHECQHQRHARTAASRQSGRDRGTNHFSCTPRDTEFAPFYQACRSLGKRRAGLTRANTCSCCESACCENSCGTLAGARSSDA